MAVNAKQELRSDIRSQRDHFARASRSIKTACDLRIQSYLAVLCTQLLSDDALSFSIDSPIDTAAKTNTEDPTRPPDHSSKTASTKTTSENRPRVDRHSNGTSYSNNHSSTYKYGGTESVEKVECFLDRSPEAISRSNSPQLYLHTFLTLGSEPQLDNWIDWVIRSGHIVAAPKTMRDRALENRRLLSLDEIEYGIWGTSHPAKRHLVSGLFDLIVVPGMAFDLFGNRMGYGGGFYDNFLKTQPDAITLAPIYDFQLVDSVPCEDHDMKVDALLIAASDQSGHLELVPTGKGIERSRTSETS